METERLYLREFIHEDASDLLALNNDKEVIKYTGDKPFKDLRDAQDFIKDYKYTFIHSNQQRRIGRWAMIRKADNAFIGWCGLKYLDTLKETDLGFRLDQKFWGQGYATEAAIACINFGFQELKLSEIVGRAMKENLASIRVLEKCGMKYRNDFVFAEHPGLCYHIFSNH
jgi:[ribosomal protein S5]-alanine N-acetyltransferase